MTQISYRRNRAKCADSILNARQESSDSPDLERQHDFWEPIFSTPSVDDQRRVKSTDSNWSILDPVSREEVSETIRHSSESSPGPDKLCLRHLKDFDPNDLAAAFNLWLLHSHVPTEVLKGETTLIFKNGDDTDPSNYRPITIASHLIRVLYRILAHRIDRDMPTNSRNSRKSMAVQRTYSCWTPF